MRPVAIIGLGGMGTGIARSLLREGFPVTVHNRTAAKAAPLAEAGASVAGSAAEAARAANCLLLSLADETAVEKVLFGELGEALRPGQLIIDTSTVSPAFARDAAARIEALGPRRIEACVMGNPRDAAIGRLRIFASGTEHDVDEVADVFEAIGQEVRYLGTPGQASSLKLAFNLLLGIQTLGLAEAVRFAESAGLERDLFLEVFESSGWRSHVLSYRAGFMRRQAYEPAGFRSALMHKDLSLALHEAADREVGLPLVRCAADRYQEVMAAGRGGADASVVVDVR